MVGSTAKNPSLKTTALFAYAAGATGILANVLLLSFFALRSAPLGTANDLVGSLGTAFMIPVALVLSAWSSDRRLARTTLLVGLSAMSVLTAGGPLLALGVLRFEAQAPIALGAWAVLSLWLVLINRGLRSSDVLRSRVARLGEFLGGIVLVAGAVAGLGLLLPWTSWPQQVSFGVGGLLAAIGMLGTPFWFLLLGRHLWRS